MRAVLILAFIASCRGEKLCHGDVVPDLNGAWVCNDNWHIDTMEYPSHFIGSKKWLLYYKLPKFYAISKIRTISICDDSFVVKLSAFAWDERFEIPNNGEDVREAPEMRWNKVDVPNLDSVGNFSQEYSGFARRAPLWKLEIDVSEILDEVCLPKFAFFARAGIAAMQHFVFDYSEADSTGNTLPDSLKAAPVQNTCDQVSRVPSDVVSRYRLDTSFYRKYTSAYGIPILSSSVVDDRALQRACYVVRFMMADRKDLRDHMYTNKGRVAIIGRRETVPMVPEMRQYTWWTRRAAGGTYHNPVNVGAEENMLCERGDGYARNQDIFMHEFAHGIHLIACHTAIPSFNARLQRSFMSARSRGLWTNTYANTDNREYFAEGVQAFFEQQREGPVGGDGIQNHINTREELRRHDPTLYNIIDELFPCYNDFIPRCNDLSQTQGLGQNLKINCKGGTGVTVGPGPVSTTAGGNCVDQHESCSYWSGDGECEKNPDYMLENCEKSCGRCETATTGAASSISPTTVPSTTHAKTSTTVTTTTTTSCADQHSNCQYWAKRGECSRNPRYMKLYCKVSCNECPGERLCSDFDANCIHWGMYCSFNRYVKNNCKKTCRSCG